MLLMAGGNLDFVAGCGRPANCLPRDVGIHGVTVGRFFYGGLEGAMLAEPFPSLVPNRKPKLAIRLIPPAQAPSFCGAMNEFDAILFVNLARLAIIGDCLLMHLHF